MRVEKQEGWPKSEWGRHLFGCLIGLPLTAFSFAWKPFRSPALRRLASQIAREIEEQPYEHWVAQVFPLTSQRIFEGQELQVEIDALEIEPDYIHINVSVDDGRLSAYFPVSTSLIVRKSNDA